MPQGQRLPFTSVSLTSVKDYVIPMVVSTMNEIGIPSAFVQNVFGGVENPLTDKHPWYAKRGANIRHRVNALLAFLSRAYYLQLNRAQELSNDLPQRPRNVVVNLQVSKQNLFESG